MYFVYFFWKIQLSHLVIQFREVSTPVFGYCQRRERKKNPRAIVSRNFLIQCILYNFSLNSMKFPGKSILQGVREMRTANFLTSSALRKEGKNTPLSHSKKKLKAIAIQKLNIFTNRNDRQGDLSSAFLTELRHNQHLHHHLHRHHCHHHHHHHLKLRIDILLYETLHQKLFV